MKAKLIIGLGSVILLASSLVAGDIHYDRGHNAHNNHKKFHKEIKRDHDRGYVKNRHNTRHYAKNRYHMKNRYKKHMRRIARNELRHTPRHNYVVRDDRLHRAVLLDLLSNNTRFYVSF